VLRVRAAAVPPAAALLPRLTADERARVAGAAPHARDGAASALLLARLVVAGACGTVPAAVRLRRRCPRCGSTEHGVPVAARADGGPVPRLSMSRTTGLVVVAVADAPVGVDVERPPGALPVPRDVLAAGEPPAAGDHGLLRTWVRKEAVLKAAGTGLAVDPRTLCVSDAAGRPAVAHPRGPLDPPAGTAWWVADVALPADAGGPPAVVAVATAVPPGRGGPVPDVDLVEL
jgi:4'-phosphopantetheinyl transferase